MAASGRMQYDYKQTNKKPTVSEQQRDPASALVVSLLVTFLYCIFEIDGQ